MQLIPYKGSSEVVQGLLTGSVDFIVDGIAPSLPLIKSGQFRPLAKLNNRRAAAAARRASRWRRPRACRVDEMSSWIGLVAPAGTPPAIVQKIHADVVRAMADAAVADRLEKAGILAVTTTPAEFEQILPRRSRTLDQGVQGERDQAGLIAAVQSSREERHERDAHHEQGRRGDGAAARAAWG